MYSEYGYSSFFGAETKALKDLDQKIMCFVEDYKLNEWFIPALIDGNVLHRCGYFSTMVNQLTKVDVVKRECLHEISNQRRIPVFDEIDNSNNVYLTPAACLHFYPMLEQNPVKNEIITTLARVYRYEDNQFIPKERQWDFTVREFVAVGTEEYVKQFLSTMREKLFALAKSIFHEVYIKEASDHFYPSKSNALKERFQLNNALKQELIANVDQKKIAIASFNFHDNHFSKEFRFDQNKTIISGCVGCGLERWLRIMEVKK